MRRRRRRSPAAASSMVTSAKRTLSVARLLQETALSTALAGRACGLRDLDDLSFADRQIHDRVPAATTQHLFLSLHRGDVQKFQAAFFTALHGFEKRLERRCNGGKLLRLQINPLVIMDGLIYHPIF